MSSIKVSPPTFLMFESSMSVVSFPNNGKKKGTSKNIFPKQQTYLPPSQVRICLTLLISMMTSSDRTPKATFGITPNTALARVATPSPLSSSAVLSLAICIRLVLKIAPHASSVTKTIPPVITPIVRSTRWRVPPKFGWDWSAVRAGGGTTVLGAEGVVSFFPSSVAMAEMTGSWGDGVEASSWAGLGWAAGIGVPEFSCPRHWSESRLRAPRTIMRDQEPVFKRLGVILWSTQLARQKLFLPQKASYNVWLHPPRVRTWTKLRLLTELNQGC